MVALVVAFVLGLILVSFLYFPRSAKSARTKATHFSHAHKGKKVYTKDEVSQHNTRTDCWIIIKDKVYDVTSYVEEHPGGDAILTHAGDDSTEGFYGPQHATRVFDMVGEFYIGELLMLGVGFVVYLAALNYDFLYHIVIRTIPSLRGEWTIAMRQPAVGILLKLVESCDSSLLTLETVLDNVVFYLWFDVSACNHAH